MSSNYYITGEAIGHLLKAGAHELSYSLSGELQHSAGWLILDVPAMLVKGFADALHEHGIELPARYAINVMTPDELESVGGYKRITERGHSFKYTIGRLRHYEPNGLGLAKIWYIQIYSPDLKRLRFSYGLSPFPGKDETFKLPIAVRRFGAFKVNKKSASIGEPNWNDYDLDYVEKCAEEYYHGSPDSNLKYLRTGSYITPDLATAMLMGRFHSHSGKTWSDDDLSEPHYFGQPAKFKPGRTPTGKPTIYALEASVEQLDKLDNTYEHITKVPLALRKLATSISSDYDIDQPLIERSIKPKVLNRLSDDVKQLQFPDAKTKIKYLRKGTKKGQPELLNKPKTYIGGIGQFVKDLVSTRNLRYMTGNDPSVAKDNRPKTTLGQIGNFAFATPFEYPLRRLGKHNLATALNWGSKGVVGLSALAGAVAGYLNTQKLTGMIGENFARASGETDPKVLAEMRNQASSPLSMLNYARRLEPTGYLGGDTSPVGDVARSVTKDEFMPWLRDQIQMNVVDSPWYRKTIDVLRSTTPIGALMTAGLYGAAKPSVETPMHSINIAMNEHLDKPVDLTQSKYVTDMVEMYNNAKQRAGQDSKHFLTSNIENKVPFPLNIPKTIDNFVAATPEQVRNATGKHQPELDSLYLALSGMRSSTPESKEFRRKLYDQFHKDIYSPPYQYTYGKLSDDYKKLNEEYNDLRDAQYIRYLDRLKSNNPVATLISKTFGPTDYYSHSWRPNWTKGMHN